MFFFSDLHKDVGLFQRLTKLEEEFKGANILLFKHQKIPKVGKMLFVAVFLGYNQYWPDEFMVYVVLCPGAPEGSTHRQWF